MNWGISTVSNTSASGTPGSPGEIPPELGRLPNLEVIDLNANQLTGSIPTEFGNLPKLRYLFARENRLSGPIPASLGDIPTLVWIRLGGNQLEGPLPPELANATGLEELLLSRNRLTGLVPSEFTQLNALYAFAWEINDGLCTPADREFQDWLGRIGHAVGPTCEKLGAKCLAAPWEENPPGTRPLSGAAPDFSTGRQIQRCRF